MQPDNMHQQLFTGVLKENSSPEDSLLKRERWDSLGEAIDELPQPERAIIISYFFGGLSIEALARAHKRSWKWTRRRYDRGLVMLKQTLQR